MPSLDPAFRAQFSMACLVIRRAHGGKLGFLARLILVFVIRLEEIAGLANVLGRNFGESLSVDLLEVLARLSCEFLDERKLLVGRSLGPRLGNEHSVRLLVILALLVVGRLRNVGRLLPVGLVPITVVFLHVSHSQLIHIFVVLQLIVGLSQEILNVRVRQAFGFTRIIGL